MTMIDVYKRQDLIGPEYLPAGEKFGLFGLKCKNTEETIRAYSMANYPAEGDRIMLTAVSYTHLTRKFIGAAVVWPTGASW